ncbi:MAG: glutathionylspermidine synthase family protein [Clostridiaceae bacterium]|nr:glutathionylspermidine synthase family protein [Clostridiaceae bacterium]
MGPVDSFFLEHKNNVLNNKKEYIQAYEEVLKKIEKSPAKYKGKAVEFLYQPMFLSEKDLQGFHQLTGELMTILNKVIDRYLEDEDFRKHFGFSHVVEKLILKDPGYNRNVPVGRFDIFYHNHEKFQFCELNADGSSGMVEVRELQSTFENSLAIEDMKKKYKLTGFEVFDSWVDALLDNYQQFSKNKEKPRVAIVDFIDTIPSTEFLEFQKTFENRGCPTVVADIRELKYKDGKLFYEDFEIDCIYRRAVTSDIDENQDKVKDFIEAYLDEAVCVVGPIRSQIIHNKNIFSILHDENKTFFLTEKERNFVKQHIPYTTKFDADNKEMIEFIINNKDQLVLKPTDKYASYGVYIGRDFSTEMWKEIIEERVGQDYLIQQFCDIPKKPMAMFTGEDVTFVENNHIIGLFMYNEKLQGIYTRTGRENVIGSVVECFTVPNFVVEKKL